MMTNLMSQAATMETYGFPYDILTSINVVRVISLVPFIDRIAYPCLRRHNDSLHATQRIGCGFTVASVAMFWVAGVLYIIYSAPPCYDHPLAKDCMESREPNRVHVAVQGPAYFLMALSEVLAAALGLEFCIYASTTTYEISKYCTVYSSTADPCL